MKNTHCRRRPKGDYVGRLEKIADGLALNNPVAAVHVYKIAISALEDGVSAVGDAALSARRIADKVYALEVRSGKVQNNAIVEEFLAALRVSRRPG